jgi:hypothetical protein
LLTVLLLALVTLFTVGCGSSSEDFVITGNNNNPNPATVGDLTFLFATAQSVTVPAATQNLEFEFFDADGDAVDFATSVFAASVTIEDVPVSAVDVIITAYGPGGIPLVTIADEVSVSGGNTVTVDLSDAVVTEVDLVSVTASPATVALDVDGPTTQQLAFTGTFSNGDVVALTAATGATYVFSGFDPAVVSVNATGLVTVVTATGGATSIDVAVSLTDDVVNLLDIPVTVGGPNVPLGTLIVEPDALVFNNGGLLGAITALTSQNFDSVALFRAFYIPPGETQPVEVTNAVGVTFNSFFPSTVTADSFAYLNLAGEGLAITANPLAPTPPLGATAVMTVTYISEGQVYTDDVQITLGNPTFDSVVVASAPGGSVTLPLNTTGSGFPTVAYARYTNGVSLPIDNGVVNFAGDTFVVDEAANTDGVAVAGNFVTVTAGTAGATVAVNITRNAEATPSASFNVNLINAVVEEVALAAADITVDPFGTYTVTVTYDDVAGTTQDVTGVWDPDTTDGTGAVGVGSIFGFQGGRLVGLQEGDALLELDDTDVNANLNTQLGLPGADTDMMNNEADITILSVISLAFL